MHVFAKAKSGWREDVRKHTERHAVPTSAYTKTLSLSMIKILGKQKGNLEGDVSAKKE